MPYDFRKLQWPSIPVTVTLLTVCLITTSPAQERLYREDGKPGDLQGTRVATIGDLDGDGVRDFLASAMGARKSKGVVRAYSGTTGGRLFTIVGPPWEGEGAPDSYGSALSSAGDVDGDGVEDILVGALGDNVVIGNEGSATVYSGASQAILHKLVGSAQQSMLGASVTDLADIDGDGLDDFAVGAAFDPNQSGVAAGSVSVYSGANAAVLYRLEGTRTGEAFGIAIDSMLDADGDGVPELIVGASGFPGIGAVHVYSGASGVWLHSAPGLIAGDQFGMAVAGLSDLDGDGRGDYLVGAPQSAPGGAGYAQVRSGASGALLFFEAGAAAHDLFGTSVASAGDVNGDGVEDFLVGASQRSVNSSRIGYARLYSGKTLRILYQFEGDAMLDDFGVSAAGLGDLDGDGRSEVAVGALTAGGTPTQPAGYFEVYSGNDLYFHLSTNQAGAGDVLTLTVGEGGPFRPVAQFVTSVNGAPVFVGFRFTNLDLNGRLITVTTVPPGLSGLTVTLRAYAQGPGGKVVDTADEVLVLQ